MWNGDDHVPPPVDPSMYEDGSAAMHWERVPETQAEQDSKPAPKPRGKPEAMAQRLAAARIQANLEELEAERLEQQEDQTTTVATQQPPPPLSPAPAAAPKDGGVLAHLEAKPAAAVSSPKPKKKVKKKPRKKPALPLHRKKESSFLEPAKPITDVEYENLEALMKQFCRVPLLAEFSRPVALLHPEIMPTYSKIVTHPTDLGHVCRGIRHRLYKSTRDVRLDVWRVFANCVKYNSHPQNKEAVPSFVSIALHLREFFNYLWQEYMLPSDPGDDVKAYMKRQKERKRNLENSGVLVLTDRITLKTSKLLMEFVENGGRTDKLDKEAIFPMDSEPDVAIVMQNLRNFAVRLRTPQEEYSVDSFHRDLTACYTNDVLEDNQAYRQTISNRLNRLFWKLLIPLHEANSRGVTQSSIWGNLAAAIWARESSKKPYWPALCLGILPPADQREGWHDAVTERNEARLPEKLRLPLETAKKKCLAAQKRISLSYFLVEFLGTHEFIWVRETDIVENFDPENDPNKNNTGKKKRASRSGVASVVGSKNYATALEECVWANEEYESVLQDAVAYTSDNEGAEAEEDAEEMNYSYSLLSQSDDEADDEDEHNYRYNETEMTMSDIDEANWLLAHEGKLDTSSAGRKNAKKRAQALKKKKASSESSKVDKKRRDSKDTKSSASKRKESRASQAREREQKKEIRELDKRRKKRMREREKILRQEARKQKRQRRADGEDEEDERGLAHNKRARATAIVRAYLTRMTKEKDYKSLALGGVLAMPTAMVDSTGLLGMALAFRAAAGEIPMPDDGKEQLAKMKPWLVVDTSKAKTSAERAEALKQQAILLEKQIGIVRANTQRRLEMAQVAAAQQETLEKEIAADDEASRRNHFKKKKKYVKASSEGKPAAEAVIDSVTKPADEIVVEADDDDDDDENIVEVESVVVDDDDDDDDMDENSVHVESVEVEDVVVHKASTAE